MVGVVRVAAMMVVRTRIINKNSGNNKRIKSHKFLGAGVWHLGPMDQKT